MSNILNIVVIGKRRTGKSRLIDDIRIELAWSNQPGRRVGGELGEFVRRVQSERFCDFPRFYESQGFKAAYSGQYTDNNNGEGNQFCRTEHPYAVIFLGPISDQDRAELEECKRDRLCVFVGTRRGYIDVAQREEDDYDDDEAFYNCELDFWGEEEEKECKK